MEITEKTKLTKEWVMVIRSRVVWVYFTINWNTDISDWSILYFDSIYVYGKTIKFL